jgi:DNA helicase-2/ATP-dependent DNA helicase PcrA
MYVGITRAEQRLYITCAQTRTLFGRSGFNNPSRFIAEISEDILEHVTLKQSAATGRSSTTSRAVPNATRAAVKRPVYNASGGDKLGWTTGDKAIHKKWGTGTVVSVRGEGENTELDIAFPSPTGIKRLLAKFAPVEKA